MEAGCQTRQTPQALCKSVIDAIAEGSPDFQGVLGRYWLSKAIFVMFRPGMSM